MSAIKLCDKTTKICFLTASENVPQNIIAKKIVDPATKQSFYVNDDGDLPADIISRRLFDPVTKQWYLTGPENKLQANPPEGYQLYFKDITLPIVEGGPEYLNHTSTLVVGVTYGYLRISVLGNYPEGYVGSGNITDYYDQPNIYIFADDGTEFQFEPDETYTENYTGVYGSSQLGSFGVDIYWANGSTDPKIAEFASLCAKIESGEISSFSVWIGNNGATNVS